MLLAASTAALHFPLGTILAVLVVAGILVVIWDLAPFGEPYKKIGKIVIALGVILFVLSATNLIGWLDSLI